MPIRPEAEPSEAAAAASTEAVRWLIVADGVPADWQDVAPVEMAVVRFHDPSLDLEQRAARWSHALPDHRLGSLALFAAGLAGAEAEAWRRGDPHIATRAYEDRRFLVGDRIIHWAVPWLDEAGRCYREHRDMTHRARDELLSLGDHLRPAPDLGADAGLRAMGEDAYGPVAPVRVDGGGLRSLWSGALLLDATVRSLTGEVGSRGLVVDAAHSGVLARLFENAAGRWADMARRHPGTGLLWNDLARRAARSAQAVSSASGE